MHTPRREEIWGWMEGAEKGKDVTHYYLTLCRELFHLNTDIYTTHLYRKHTRSSAQTVWQYAMKNRVSERREEIWGWSWSIVLDEA